MPEIIAELCQNHNGEIKILEEMVHAASEAKADYVKIQSMSSNDLTYRKRFEKGLIEGNQIKTLKRPFLIEKKRLKKNDLTIKDHFKFLEFCQKYKIKPLTSVFNYGWLPFVNKLNLNSIKISSFDCSSVPLILEIAKQKKRRLIISTGGAFDREIIQTSKALKNKNVNFSFLHCISIYPTPLHEANLNRIKYLKKFSNSVGISDHSNPEKDGNKLSISAVLMGASIVERHFTILPKNKTKDGIVSVNFKQLKNLVEMCKQKKNVLSKYVKKNIPEFKLMKGSQNRELSDSELLNRDYYKGRFSTIKNKKVYFNWEKFK